VKVDDVRRGWQAKSAHVRRAETIWEEHCLRFQCLDQRGIKELKASLAQLGRKSTADGPDHVWVVFDAV
jgi:hypothetical protein